MNFNSPTCNYLVLYIVDEEGLTYASYIEEIKQENSKTPY